MTYEEWDEARRRQHPNARHDRWDSYDGSEHVATWNPHNGRCAIQSQPCVDQYVSELADKLSAAGVLDALKEAQQFCSDNPSMLVEWTVDRAAEEWLFAAAGVDDPVSRYDRP